MKTSWVAIITILMTSWAVADINVPSLKTIDNRAAREADCKSHTTFMHKQQQRNRNQGCGFTGALWKTTVQQEHQRCLQEAESVALGRNNQREKQLGACLEKKATNDIGNRPAVPASCLDPEKNYQAVKSLYRSYRYKKKLTSPVRNGLIRYDFNRDDSNDFVFTESNGEMARIVICLSKGSRYQRKPTDLTFSAMGDSIEARQYRIDRQDNRLNVTINFFGHNMGSSTRHISYRYNIYREGFDPVLNRSSTSPVIYDAKPYPISAPATPRLYTP